MQERLAKLQQAMPEEMDAALITSPLNRRYYTGFPSSAGVVVVTRQQCYFIVDARYHEAAQAAIPSCEVVLQERLHEQIYALLQQHQVKTLGIESQAVTVSQLRVYTEGFAGVNIPTDDQLSALMSNQRAIKTAPELDCMRAAQAIADRCFTRILDVITPGVTEREIAAEIEIFCLRQGVDGMAFDTIVASGPNSSKPHAVPGERRIRRGDFITMDFGCKVGGYCSDMTRTVAVGQVSARQRDGYETVLTAQLAALNAIHGGVECKNVDKAARDIIDASAFKGGFTHSLGHGIGLEAHEPPRCSENSPHILQPGMVTSVEPGIYLAGEFGVRIEDCVLVTEIGSENLCHSPKELIVL